METPEHKQYQKLYQQLVTDHEDDFSKMEFVESEELLENAKSYFLARTFPLIYPAKSLAVAVIYALLLEEVYGIDPISSLNDPDLFLGQDPYYRSYEHHPDVYDQLLKWVREQPNWNIMGWASQTCEYFHLECTAEGIDEVMGKL